MKEVMLCAICNMQSGNCSEDCAFCIQSAYNKSDIKAVKRKSIEQVVNEAEVAKKYKSASFCLVTSGRALNEKTLDFVCEAASAVKKKIEITLIACNGVATTDQLRELKKAGVDVYNHNIETSKEFYTKICSTHDWDERFQTCLNVKEVGLYLCCGGIFGIGESAKDRTSYIKSLQELDPYTSTINYFISHLALARIKAEPIDEVEGLEIIKALKKALPASKLLLAGGRELVFGDDLKSMFEAGADAMVLGDYLNAKGEKPLKDLKLLETLGVQIVAKCHE